METTTKKERLAKKSKNKNVARILLEKFRQARWQLYTNIVELVLFFFA